VFFDDLLPVPINTVPAGKIDQWKRNPRLWVASAKPLVQFLKNPQAKRSFVNPEILKKFWKTSYKIIKFSQRKQEDQCGPDIDCWDWLKMYMYMVATYFLHQSKPTGKTIVFAVFSCVSRKKCIPEVNRLNFVIRLCKKDDLWKFKVVTVDFQTVFISRTRYGLKAELLINRLFDFQRGSSYIVTILFRGVDGVDTSK
jgi:hypothetical protein